jgi:hypothetical protein
MVPSISHFIRELSPRYRHLLAISAVLLLYFFYIYGVSTNPPGFYLDESGLAYNAYLLAKTGKGEFGAPLPLFFQFYTGGFSQFASPTHVYLLALAFLFFPPSILVARIFAATIFFLASLLLGVLATRVSHRRVIGIIVALIALTTPWLFEISRLVLETFFYPMAIVLFLLAVHRAHLRERWSLSDHAMLAATLALLTYSYTIGRLLGPLLAMGLFLFVINKRRLIDVAKTWLLYALTFIPLIVFNARNPGRLMTRFYLVSYIKPQTPWQEIPARFIGRYFEDLNLNKLLWVGDINPRHHAPGLKGTVGSFLLAPFILAVMGIILVLVRYRHDAWWRFVLYGLIVSIMPGALTIDQAHSLRNIAHPIFLLLLTVPALEWLLEKDKLRAKQGVLPSGKGWVKTKRSDFGVPLQTRRVILALLLAATFLQAAYFQRHFRQEGPLRGYVFDTAYKQVYDAAVAQTDRPIYLVDGYWGPAYIHAYWYATVEGRNKNEFVHLDYGSRPPRGGLAISSEDKCVNCDVIVKHDIYMLYRVP